MMPELINMGIDKTIILTILITSAGFIGILLAGYGSRKKTGMSSTSMYNVAGCLVIASIISCTISFFAICMALKSGSSNNFYQQDVIVDILAVLVTVLMGWNIISVVDIKRNAEKINTISNDLEMVISGVIQLNFHSFEIRKDREAVIDSCFETLNYIHQCENVIVRQSAEKEIIKLLGELKKTYRIDEKVEIYPGKKDKYLFALSLLKDVFAEDIKGMISNADVVETRSDNNTLAYSHVSDNGSESDYIATNNGNKSI